MLPVLGEAPDEGGPGPWCRREPHLPPDVLFLTAIISRFGEGVCPPVCVHGCMHVHMSTSMRACEHACTCTWLCVPVRMCTCTHVHCAHACMCVHVCMRVVTGREPGGRGLGRTMAMPGSGWGGRPGPGRVAVAAVAAVASGQWSPKPAAVPGFTFHALLLVSPRRG
uniref:Uncharacterized protein n=1 Tax=Rousettus aegyptiacus TaxID=9407 RepID=A0A7J8E8N9_ROUAE|nr:hypothetical protein HJG63_008086 [Rousettus aegyptiacus]